MQLKNATAFAYEDSLRAGVASRADWEARKAVETHEQGGEEVESADCADIAKLGNYFTCSEFPED